MSALSNRSAPARAQAQALPRVFSYPARATPIGPSPWQLAAKRVFDCAAAITLLTLLAPLLGMLMLLVWIDSGGPVLFAQLRVGRQGKPFRCLKLRTMRPEAEQMLKRDAELRRRHRANNFKLPTAEDPRVTRIGRLLRRTSLDELPQLLNVVRGEMSLVGPRPVVPDELIHYGADARKLLSVRPGITGSWAVNGRNRVDYPERVRLELQYVDTWSLVRDLVVLGQTIPVVLFGIGAE